jgi:NAD(P)H-hydrate epimerase
MARTVRGMHASIAPGSTIAVAPALPAVSALAAVPAASVPSASAAQVAEVNRLAIEAYGITLPQMLELAGSHLAEVVRLELGGDLGGCHVVVAVGPEDHGGGGLLAARHLVNRGATVSVVLAQPALRMSAAARHQLATLLVMGTSCRVTTYDLSDVDLADALAGADLIVDAILDPDARGPLHGEVERLLGFIADSGRPVVSLDVPSGIDPDTGVRLGPAVAATATLALALPKPGLLAGAGAGHAGRLYLGDLGVPATLYASLGLAVGPIFATGRIIILDRTP